MLIWIKKNKLAVGGGGVVVLGIVGYLAFAVFGVHTLFIDDVVSEEGPVFSSGATATTAAASGAVVVTTVAPADDPIVDETSDGETPVDETAADDPTADAETAENNPAEEPVAQDPAAEEPDANAAGEIVTVASGSFIGRAHGAEGTVVVLNDGSAQRFLRFEDDFATDNGPDLFVYLSKGTTADGPNGDFDEDFVNLGSLSGNVGSQNYEIPEGLDLSEYNTVSVWCRRFSVAFAAADLVGS